MTMESATSVQGIAFQAPGTCQFKVARALAGNPGGTITTTLPPLLDVYYGVPEGIRIGNGRQMYQGQASWIHDGAPFLVLLKRDAKENWVPVDELLPLIPLSAAALAEATKPGNELDVVGLLAASLNDASVRQLDLHLLMEVEDKRLADVAFKYRDDPDTFVRDYALMTMATNQDIRAIPLIDQYAKTSTRGNQCTMGLARYQTKAALPALHELLAHGAEWSRLKAFEAVARFADPGSIPYLIEALKFNYSQKNPGAYDIYLFIQKLVGTTPTFKSPEDFLAHRAEEVQKLTNWWQARQPV